MGYDLRPKKLAKRMQVKCKFKYHCDLCLAALQDYCTAVGTLEIPDYSMADFFVPYEWFEANEKRGCPHIEPIIGGEKFKLLESSYEKKAD